MNGGRKSKFYCQILSKDVKVDKFNPQPNRQDQAKIDIGLSSILDSRDFQQEMCNFAFAGHSKLIISGLK